MPAGRIRTDRVGAALLCRVLDHRPPLSTPHAAVDAHAAHRVIGSTCCGGSSRRPRASGGFARRQPPCWHAAFHAAYFHTAYRGVLPHRAVEHSHPVCGPVVSNGNDVASIGCAITASHGLTPWAHGKISVKDWATPASPGTSRSFEPPSNVHRRLAVQGCSKARARCTTLSTVKPYSRSSTSGGGGAEALDAQHVALRAGVALPASGDAQFHRQAGGDVGRRHVVAVAL